MIRDIPHERPIDPWEANERAMERERHRQAIRRGVCQEFLGQIDEFPDPETHLGAWLMAEVERRLDRQASSPEAREDNSIEAAAVASLIEETLIASAPLDVVMAIADGR